MKIRRFPGFLWNPADHDQIHQGGSGYVIGPAASSGRICVQFEQREDQSENRLNCLPDEPEVSGPRCFFFGLGGENSQKTTVWAEKN